MLLDTMKKEYIERKKAWNYAFERLNENKNITKDEIEVMESMQKISISYMVCIETILRRSGYDVDNFIKECLEVVNNG